jgi:Uri superfamily endonuclease
MQGSYILLLELMSDHTIRVGSLGVIRFPKGYYMYVGSGLKNLDERVKRHLRKNNKKLHWHIDYLLEEAEVTGVYFKESSFREECSIAEKLKDLYEPIPGFGSSDCRCRSHLFKCGVDINTVFITEILKMKEYYSKKDL